MLSKSCVSCVDVVFVKYVAVFFGSSFGFCPKIGQPRLTLNERIYFPPELDASDNILVKICYMNLNDIINRN